MVGGEAAQAIGAQAAIAAMLFVLFEPCRDRGRRDAPVSFVLEAARRSLRACSRCRSRSAPTGSCAGDEVLLWSAAGPGVKTRLQAEAARELHDLEFFLRVPRRVRLRPPQWGRDSGCLLVSGTRAMRGMGGDILLIVCVHRIMRCTEIEKGAHAFWWRCGSRILEGERDTERGVGRPFLLC